MDKEKEIKIITLLVENVSKDNWVAEKSNVFTCHRDGMTFTMTYNHMCYKWEYCLACETEEQTIKTSYETQKYLKVLYDKIVNSIKEKRSDELWGEILDKLDKNIPSTATQQIAPHENKSVWSKIKGLWSN